MAVTLNVDYENKKKEIVELIGNISKTSEKLNELNIKSFDQNKLKDQIERIKNNKLKVLVLGGFSNGKTTFLNALMGSEILPTSDVPCTAVINEIKYGSEEKALLYFKNPLPENWEKLALSEEIIEHIKSHEKEGKIPPFEMKADLDDLFDTITIPDDDEEGNDDFPAEKAVIYYPLGLLKNGVEIIDSPGLDEDVRREAVTQEYIQNADAIIIVLNSKQLLSDGEHKFIESLRDRGYNDIFIVCNFYDLVSKGRHAARELPKFEKRIKTKVIPLTDLGEDGVFLVSSLEALEAKEERDQEKLKESGILKVENELSSYLTEAGAKQKLKAILTPLEKDIQKNGIKNIQIYIDGLKTQSKETGEDFQKRIENAEADLKESIDYKDQIEEKIKDRSEQIKRHMKELADEEFDQAVTQTKKFIRYHMTIETPVSASLFKSEDEKKREAKAVSEEANKKINNYFQDRISKWAKEDAYQSLEKDVADMNEILNPLIKDFYKALQSSQKQIISNLTDSTEEIDRYSLGSINNDPSAFLSNGFSITFGGGTKRVALDTVTALIGLGLATTGVGIGIAAFATLMMHLFGTVGGEESIREKYRDQIYENYSKNAESNKENFTSKFSDQVYDSVRDKCQKEILSVLDNEVKSQKDIIRGLKNEMKGSIEEKEQKINKLEDIKKEFQNYSNRANDLMNQIK